MAQLRAETYPSGPQIRPEAGTAVAVVIGSGLAGLAAAQVLSEHFQRVLVIERDRPAENNEKTAVEIMSDEKARPGVDQVRDY